MDFGFFLLFAGLAVFSALMMVTRKNVVHSALFLVSTLFWVAALYVLLQAEFLAAVQVLIYAGAIMVLILFTVLLIQMEEVQKTNPWHRQWPLALLIGPFLLLEIVLIVRWTGRRGLFPFQVGELTSDKLAALGNTEAFGQLLFTRYFFPFEVASVLLLAAMIGAIVLAKKELGK